MSLAVIEPKPEYDRKNEAAFREEVRKLGGNAYDRRGDLTVPFGKKLAFTSAQGQVIAFGYNTDGNFTIQQDANTPFGLASLSFVTTVESTLEASIATLETSLTAELGTLSASFSALSVAFTDLETSFAALYVDVAAANDAAAAAATSAMSAATSATAAGTSATAANTSATSAATQASNAATSASAASTSAGNASTSASAASTSASNAAGSASTAATQATNAANSATSAGNSASAASTSASNASTSATNAGNSASAASTSATNAASSETAAGNSATAASTSASTASTQATNAGTSASNAATSASNAATSASAAGTSASAASTSASSASTSASNAATSASAAQTSLVSARAAAASAFPSTFDNRTLFTETIYGLTPTPFGESDSRFSSVSGEGIVFTCDTDAGAIAGLATFRPVAGRTYKVTARVRVTVNPTVRTTDSYVGFHTMDATGATLTYSGSVNYYGIVAADGWRNLSHTVTGDTLLALGALARPITLLNWNDGGGTPGDSTGNYFTDSTMQAAFLKFEDITESTGAATSASAAASSASSASASQSAAASSASAASTSATNAATQASNAATSASQASTSETNAAGSASTASTAATAAASSQSAAAGSASAASTSASTASTQASNAATSASAAATSATTASTQASNASTSASAASTSAGNAASSATTAGTHASNASGSASSASSSASAASASATAASNSATLSATYAAGSQGSINSSATFADNANATGVPTNWGDWVNGSGTRVTGIAPQPYAFTLVGGAGASAGIYSPLTGRIATGWHVIEADVTLNSGAFTGAGVYLDWDGSGNLLSFSSDADITGSVVGAGTPGQLYRFRKLVEVVKGASYNGMYAMCHWGGGSFGSIASANSITWHRCAIRAASQAEIEARQAKLDLVTTNANVATNTSAIASNTSAISSLTTTVSANYTALDTKTNVNQNFMPYPNGTGDNALASTVSWNVFSAPTPTQALYMPFYAPSGGAFYYIIWSSGYNSGGSAYIVYQFPVGVTAGQTYTLSMVGTTSLAGVTYTIGARNSGLADLGFATDVPLQATRNSVSYTMPTGAAWAIVVITIPAQNSAGAYRELTFRNIKFELGSSATAFSQEGDIRQTNTNLATANANIATNASAIATETSARAAADTTLAARFNVKANLFPYPQPLNTTVPSGWVHTGLTIGTWQPLGGWFYYKARASGGSATTEYYYYDLEPTNTAYIDATATNQYTLSAVGYGGSGASGDRLMMYIELLDSGGTVINASTPVLLNNYYPDPRPSTTTSYSGAGEYVRRRIVFRREWAASGSYQDAVFNYIKVENGSVATAYTAEGASSTLQASVTTNASAIATINGAAAFWETIVSASGGDLAAVRLKAGASGSYLELISTVLRLANVSNGSVIEVMRAIGGEAFFSRPVSVDSASRRLTIGPGYGVSGSEVVLWFGPVATAPSSQSRTNGYFALGTDSKIYLGSGELVAPVKLSVSAAINDTTNPYSGTITVTATGGTGTGYTYNWSKQVGETGIAATLGGTTTATVTVSASLGSGQESDGRVQCVVYDSAGNSAVISQAYSLINTA